MTKEMQVPMIGGVPYKWPHKKNDFPHQFECSIDCGAAFACMSSLSKNVWVPTGWKEKVRGEWADFRRRLSNTPRWTRPDGTDHDCLKETDKLDHWAVSRIMRQGLDMHVEAVHEHNLQVDRLYGQIGSKRKKPNVEKVTPEEWTELRDCFQKFTIPAESWTSDMEKEKWEQLFDFLTRGNTPDGVNVGEESKPQLSLKKAGAVLWFLNEALGIDWHDLRCQPCPRCGDFCDTNDMRCCEHCGIHICEDCMEYDIGFCTEHQACKPCCKHEKHEEES